MRSSRTRITTRILLLAIGLALLTISAQAQTAADTTAAVAAAAAAPAAAPAADASLEEQQISCRVHVVNNTESPDNNMLGHVRSSLKVLAAADIADVSVILQVQHPDVAALEVTLTAAGTSKNSTKVTLKTPTVGVAAGANMVQTIFSDYAPAAFPNKESEAPYSSVYRPAEPLTALVSGDATAAGAGGSQGVWTLAVTDTAAAKRPLKLTGWELWLCGASNGPLFAPVGQNLTAFDGSAVVPEVSIVKKRVAVPSKSDVVAVVKAAKRKAGDDPAAEIIDQVNTFLADKLASTFEAINPLIKAASAPVAALLDSSAVSAIANIKGMPKLMGYVLNNAGRWELPTSEAAIKDFLETLQRCKKDLFWCWQEAGLEGNFAQDFVATWESRAQPVAETWAALQKQWLGAVGNFEETNPELAAWGDALFYSAVNNLYRAAQLDAVATVAESWGEVAIGLALYISPLRFAVNPRAFIIQGLASVELVLRSLFNAFQYATQLTDGDSNNDVEAITAFTQALLDANRQAFDLMTLGVRTRAEAIQNSLAASAGGMARSAASLNEQVAESLGAIDPRLGAIYNSSTDGINQLLREIATTQQDAVERYLRASNNRMNFADELDKTMTLGGQIITQMATNAATAIKSAQSEIDKVLPGPPLQAVLTDLRATIEDVLSTAQSAIQAIIPTPEIEEADALMRATVQVTLGLLDNAASSATGGDGAQAIGQELNRLATNLAAASDGVSSVMGQINTQFPGPLFNATLEGIQSQGARTVTNIQRMFQGLARDYPNLDPATFTKELGGILGGLTASTLDMTTAFENLAPNAAVAQLGKALPGALQPVIDTVREGSKNLPALFARTPNADSAERVSDLQQQIGEALEGFAGQVKAIAESLPNQPPVAAITGRLDQRTGEVYRQSNELQSAIVNYMGAPREVLRAATSDFNARLENLLMDLKGQQAQAAQLGEVLSKGPLADVVKGLDNMLEPVDKAVTALTSQLPKSAELRQVLDVSLSAPVQQLSSVVQQASQTALQATAVINKGGVQALAGLLERLTGLMQQGQMQVAGMLRGAGEVSAQLAAVAPAVDLSKPLQDLDTVLASTVGSVTKEVEATLSAFGPPEAVIQGLVTPLAKQLNDGLGGPLKGVEAGSQALTAILQGLPALMKNIANGASAALGLPVPAAAPGRHLLTTTPLVLPAGFDAPAFNGVLRQALLGAGTQFANAAVAAINGRPGVSAAAGALQQYVERLTEVAGKFDSFLEGLPQGKVLSLIFDAAGGGKVIDSLTGLSSSLSSAAAGDVGPIVGQIAKVLGSMVTRSAAAAEPAVAAQQQVLPNAAGLLAAFQQQLAAAVSGGN